MKSGTFCEESDGEGKAGEVAEVTWEKGRRRVVHIFLKYIFETF